MASDWTSYIFAAHRKTAISQFHLAQLDLVLARDEVVTGGFPSIAAQAHFEGVIIAAISAVDQVCQAANSALKLGAGGDTKLFEVAAPQIVARVPEFEAWQLQPFGIDLRRIRARMIHYSYEKEPHSDRNWHVEDAGSGYDGPRDLHSYAKAAMEYAAALDGIADKLSDSLLAEQTRGI